MSERVVLGGRGRLRRSGVVALIAITVFAIGCGGSDDSSDRSSKGSASTEPIKIGVTLPLTGGQAAIGQAHLTGLKAGVKYVNDNGGVLGGRKLELVTRDTGGVPTQAAAVAREIIEQDVTLVVSDSLSGDSLAQWPVFNRAKIPTFFSGTEQSGEDPKKNPYVFMIGETGKDNPRLAIDYLKGAAGKTRIGVLYENNAFGQAQYAFTKSYAQEAGVDLVAVEAFQTGATNVGAQIRKLKAAGADGLIVWTFGPGLVAAVQGLQSEGWKVPTIAPPGVGASAVTEAVGAEALETVYGLNAAKSLLVAKEGETPPEESAPYRDNMPANYQGDVSNPAYLFDIVWVMAQAIEKAGSDDPEAIKQAIETGGPFDGVRSKYTFSPTDHSGLDLSSIGVFRADTPCTLEGGCVAGPGVL